MLRWNDASSVIKLLGAKNVVALGFYLEGTKTSEKRTHSYVFLWVRKMMMEARIERLAMVANMPRTRAGSPPPRIEVAMNGPMAKPKNLAELRKPIAVPLLRVPLPPRRKVGIPAWMAPAATRIAMK